MYMYTAMADLVAERGDAAMKSVLEGLWSDVTTKQMYITAGLGPSKFNEGFTAYYDLPNDTAYAETCASVALIFWAQRMLNLECDGVYADVMEQALYNGALSGLSREGTHYFYQNPLESDGSHRRWEWHPCPCCTMNIARLVASIGGYFYSTGSDVLAVHLYGSNTGRLSVGENRVRIRQETEYPWSGAVRIRVEPEAAAEFTLKLRVPGWARDASASVNGKSIDTNTRTRGYLEIRRRWTPGDTVALDLPMPVERLYAHPEVRADIGRTALKRGPLVYCLEHADNDGIALERARLPRDAKIEAREMPHLFDGIVGISAAGRAVGVGGWDDRLYQSAPPDVAHADLLAIPYYLWCNRGPGRMLVWIPEA
jgi:DUF1680 family protein